MTTAGVGSPDLHHGVLLQRHDTAFSPAGPAAWFARTRLFAWLERTGWTPTVHAFGRDADAARHQLARHPARSLAAVAALEREATVLRNRTFVLREAVPFGSGGIERRLMTRSRIAVYDVDTPMYASCPGDRGAARRVRRHEAAVRAADVVLVANEVLAERAEWLNANVVVVPSCVDVAAHPPKADHELGAPPVIGCLASPSAHRHLRQSADRLLAEHRRSGARILLLNSRHPSFGPLEAMIDRVHVAAGDVRPLSAMDVAITPVDDTEAEQGRTATGLLHLAAAGVPTVSTALGAHREVARHVGAVAVSSADELHDAVLALLAAPAAARAALAARSVQGVARHYSYDRWHGRWCAAVGL